MKDIRRYLMNLIFALGVILFLLGKVGVLPEWYVWLSGALIFLTSAEQIWRKWSVGMVAICAVAILSLLVFFKHLLGL